MSEIKANLDAKAFILKNADTTDKEGLLQVYSAISELYDLWNTNGILDVEMSVKISHGQVIYDRYAIPIIGTPIVSMDMVSQLLDIIDAPKQLLDIIRKKHSQRIRMLVGFDYDSKGKRIYFNDGNQAFGYQFVDSSKYVVKYYTKVEKKDYNFVLDGLNEIFSSSEVLALLLNIIPFDKWTLICERKQFTAEREVIGYHISTVNKPQICDIQEDMMLLVKRINTSIDSNKFKEWIDKNTESRLYWVGIGIDKERCPELTFYIRPGLQDWDVRYTPREFTDFFALEIMNL